MIYRVTIEKESPSDREYHSWDEVYQQILTDLDVEAVVTGLNSYTWHLQEKAKKAPPPKPSKKGE